MDDIVDFVRIYIEDMKVLEEETNELAMALENNIKEEAPYDQGRLRRSIRVDTRIADTYSIIAGTYDEGLAPHGDFVLMGTRPHKIEAKSAGGIFYEGIYTEPGKNPHPYKSVMHPGTKPDDFLGRGLQQTVENYR